MPRKTRFIADVGAGLTQRFASKESRFRLAVLAGFLVAAVGFTTVVISDQDTSADTMFGLSDFFGGQREAPQQAESAGPSGWAGWLAPHRHARHEARRHIAKVERAHFIRSAEHVRTERAHDDGGPMRLGRASMCVRLCDGFAFPVGAYHGEEDRASHEATCHSECPGAATALYIMPSGSDSMDDAVRVGTDKNYSELPYAFHYTTVLSDACTCHPPGGNRIKSLLHDFTLRRGDAVMTSKGFKVFHGASRFPYKRNDFVTLAQSRDIRKADRASFHEIERASLISTPNVVAQTTSPAPAAHATTTKGLEHQASISPPGSPRAP